MGTDYPGLGTRRYVERRIAPGEEYLIAGHTERQQNEILLEGDLVITDRSRDGSRSHGSGGQCSRRWSRWLSSLSESEASPYDRLRYEPDYPSVTMTRDTDAIETRELTKRFGTDCRRRAQSHRRPRHSVRLPRTERGRKNDDDADVDVADAAHRRRGMDQRESRI